jgi:transcriptional regulator with XRE-family HTH domain
VEVDVEKLKELRINAGFSQRELATRAGLTPGAVWQVEHRKSGSPATLKKLADVLGVEVGDFYPKVQASLWPEEEPERRNPEPGEAERRRWRNPDATEARRIAEEINLPPFLDSLNIVDIMRDVVDADRRRNEQQITRHRESGESQTTYSSVVREFEHRMEDQLGGAFGGFMYSGLRNSVLRILDLEEENARLKKEVETAQERAANV